MWNYDCFNQSHKAVEMSIYFRHLFSPCFRGGLRDGILPLRRLKTRADNHPVLPSDFFCSGEEEQRGLPTRLKSSKCSRVVRPSKADQFNGNNPLLK